MEDHIKELSGLMSLKKAGKKEPSQMERSQFKISWAGLVTERGFNEEAETFLYEGYTYCGAEPFFDYMKKTDSYMDTLNELYKGKLYGENCVSSSSILFHLLSLSMNTSNIDTRVIVSLIQHIPCVLKNKEGKLYGQADRVIKKYFFDKLAPSAKYLALSDMAVVGLSPDSFKEFSNIMKLFVKKMDISKFSKKCQENIYKVDIWINQPLQNSETAEKSFVKKISSAEETPSSETVAVPDKPKNQDSTKNETAYKSEKNEQGQPDYTNNFLSHDEEGSGFKQEDTKATEETSSFKAVSQSEERSISKEKSIVDEETVLMINAQIAELSHINKIQKEQIEKLEQLFAEKESVIKSFTERINSYENENSSLRAAVSSSNKKLELMSGEILQKDSMIDMLRRDRNHQSNEAIKRLAGKLQYFYADYVDAKGLEMSEDLGENMRDQLGEVFKILIDAGITL